MIRSLINLTFSKTARVPLAYPKNSLREKIMSLSSSSSFGFSDGKKHGNQQKEKRTQTEPEGQQKPANQFQINKTMIGISGVAGFALYYLMSSFSQTKQNEDNKEAEESPNDNKKLAFGGQWTLIDTNQKTFGSNQLKGSNYLMYFGFSKCPDVCPTTLSYINSLYKAYQDIPQAQGRPLRVVFVSVDPDRDTPGRLNKYLSNFNRDFIGVTAENENDPRLKDCLKSFKVYARKISDKQNQNEYNVDHTSLIFFMSQQNEFLDIVNTAISGKESAEAILARIKQNEKVQK